MDASRQARAGVRQQADQGQVAALVAQLQQGLLIENQDPLGRQGRIADPGVAAEPIIPRTQQALDQIELRTVADQADVAGRRHRFAQPAFLGPGFRAAT